MVGDFGHFAHPVRQIGSAETKLIAPAVFGPVAHFAGTKTKRRNGWGWGGRIELRYGELRSDTSPVQRIPQNPLFVEFIRPSKHR